ncbi:MAG TPA: serine--tRNA ligase [Candidatus Nanoarchaeia archaeon]|nr:serine--tRNA ligase [Candidatus Nanoarchaeia archaeon]
MIDIKLIRENRGLVKENIKDKFQDAKLPLVDTVRELDENWRKLKAESDNLRAERNSISKQINEVKKSGKDASDLLKKAKKIPEQIAEIEKESESLQAKINEIMLQIPNIISDDAPKGKDASENKEIKKWGKIPKFKFPVKNHVQLSEELKIADFDASARVSGNGFYYLKGDLALLNQALIRFAIDFMSRKKYEYIETPLMLNGKSIYASMNKEAIAQSVYDIKDEDLHLIGTAEQSLLAMHAGNTFAEAELPKKYFSYSMCFRKEVGSHGINEKGLWRTHQFNKIEQFVFCKPEESNKIYLELLKNSEEILKALKLPYRVLEICSGDLADWKYRSADLEVYRPTTKKYEEVMSLSNCTDYQARKLGIKYFNKKGERVIVHTLNDTALATSRILVAILENNQQKDSTIKIPSVLVKYMNGMKVIGAPLKAKSKEKPTKKTNKIKK